MENSFRNVILDKQWVVEEIISFGYFADVYFGKHVHSGEKVAIKLSKEENVLFPRIMHEHKIYKSLQSSNVVEQIPQVLSFGHSEGQDFLVMTLLGATIDDLLFRRNFKFSNKTIMMIGYQLVQVLQKIHDKGIVHRDVHERNIMVGSTEDNCSTIYLADFEGSDPAGRQAYGYTKDNVDMINFLIKLLSGKQKSIKTNTFSCYSIDAKWKRTVKTILHETNELRADMGGVPMEVYELVESIKKVPFFTRPNYKLYNILFNAYFERTNCSNDGQFDWIK